MLKTARNLLLGGAILSAILCTFHAEFILGLIYKNDVSASVLSFQFLMWSFIGMSITLIYGTLLTANGNLRFLNQISFVGVLVNVVFNAFLIPTYGAAGAAFATLVTQSLIALLQLVYCHSKFSIPFSRFNSLNYLFFIATLLIIPFLIVDRNTQFILQLSSGILGLFIFKFIDVKQLKETLQAKQAENEINEMI
jgi:O-antigen/teichoic acid export membrane protein